jgi:hypothetical protein
MRRMPFAVSLSSDILESECFEVFSDWPSNDLALTDRPPCVASSAPSGSRVSSTTLVDSGHTAGAWMHPPPSRMPHNLHHLQQQLAVAVAVASSRIRSRLSSFLTWVLDPLTTFTNFLFSAAQDIIHTTLHHSPSLYPSLPITLRITLPSLFHHSLPMHSSSVIHPFITHLIVHTRLLKLTNLSAPLKRKEALQGRGSGRMRSGFWGSSQPPHPGTSRV